MIIDAISNGIVIDHISAGKAMELYNILGLDKLDCSVALLKNVSSGKLGRKDIIKIDQVLDLDWDVIGYVDTGITVNIIKDGKLITAPTDNLILPGIVRAHLIKACKKLEIPVSETPYTLDEMFDADEVLVTSSSKLCMYANELDGKPVGGKAPELLEKIRKEIMDEFMTATN